MTLELLTKSHGCIDSGFDGRITSFSRLGKYSFKTKDLCELVKNFVENPDVDRLLISGYQEESMPKSIPVTIDYENNSVKFAEYEIEGTYFKILIDYIIRGGHYGWLNGKPDFVDETRIAIKKSRNSLFRGK